MAEGITVTCSICGLVQRMDELQPGMAAECFRCGSVLVERKTNSLVRTAALSLAALILYIPANIYPILRMERYGAYSESTVWDGCVKLFQNGQWVVVVVVLTILASASFDPKLIWEERATWYTTASTNTGRRSRFCSRTPAG